MLKGSGSSTGLLCRTSFAKTFLSFSLAAPLPARQHLVVASLGGCLTGTSEQSIQLNLSSFSMCFRLRIYCELRYTHTNAKRDVTQKGSEVRQGFFVCLIEAVRRPIFRSMHNERRRLSMVIRLYDITIYTNYACSRCARYLSIANALAASRAAATLSAPPGTTVTTARRGKPHLASA